MSDLKVGSRGKTDRILDARRAGQDETGDSSLARLRALNEGDVISAKVFRFDPTTDVEPHYDTYEIPYSKYMRVLDALTYISEELGEDLAHRWFCGVKKCGTCAVRMNGREILACWESAEREMVIEPLRHAPIIRDLVVDRQPYEDRIISMMPWLARDKPYPGWPERVSHVQMASASEALDCLSCMACYSACPVLDLGDETNFAGPAPLVQLAQTALDPRDGALDRGKIAMEQGGIFNCVSCYKCEEVCPVGIPIVSGILEPLKAKAYQSQPEGNRHATAFLSVILKRGRIDPSELVLKTQGIKAAFKNLNRTWALLMKGKINPLQTFFGEPSRSAPAVKRLFEKTENYEKRKPDQS